MTLEQFDAAIRKGEDHNTRVLTERKLYADRLRSEFGVGSTEELAKMLADGRAQLAEKEAEYAKEMAEGEAELRKAGLA